ncbi:DUF2922 domain-containing protein [Caldibacillus debilis]|uniref:DUF2922 domain-containing protein n=1 Tax=Caldibacillus debilis TaxID=301148 RepID=UPI00038107E6|nr:DUF2922 domain-containing protein [Caldibacillus debilis]
MAKTLMLYFLTGSGKTVNLSVNDPKEPLNGDEIKSAMEQIIAADVFEAKGESLAAVKEARLVDRNVEIFPMS